MPGTYGSYALVGGTAVKIAPLEVTEPGTIYADEGCAFNPVVCDVSGGLEETAEDITAPGTVILTPGDGKIGFSKVTINTDVSGLLEEGSETIRANGETTLTPSGSNIGFSSVALTTEVYALKTIQDAPDVVDGTYIFTATDSNSDTVVGICVIASGTVDASYGDGTFTIDSSGDAPMLEWTPTITAETVTVWYAASVEA